MKRPQLFTHDVQDISDKLRSYGIDEAFVHLEAQEFSEHLTARSTDRFQSTETEPLLYNESSTRTEEENSIYGFDPLVINITYIRILAGGYDRVRGLTWNTFACDIFNEYATKRETCLIRQLWGNPTIIQLLLHQNAIAPLDMSLSKDDFLISAYQATIDRYKERFPHKGWVEYSEGNHVFAGMILEVVTGKTLPTILEEVVFRPLAMLGTSMNDGTHLASYGMRTSMKDIKSLYREILRPSDSPGAILTEAERDLLLRLSAQVPNGNSTTLIGTYGSLESIQLGIESMIPPILPCFGVQKCKKMSDKHPVYCFRAGSTSVVMSLNPKGIIIVTESSLSKSLQAARYVFRKRFV